MKHTKRFLALLLIIAAIGTLPVMATETEIPTLPPIYVGVRQMDTMPESWNPLGDLDENQKAILQLTAEPLYRVDETGTLVPAQAAQLPADVTAEFAGSYGIPGNARRGYAFALTIREGASWENGTPVTAEDWCYTVEKLLEADRFPLELANYRAFLRGETKPAAEIISLKDAGFGSLAEAEAAGHSDFYIDVTHFWGLEDGWKRISDRSRLTDAAIPSGCEEMYLTAEYLYRTYLSDTGSHKNFQSRFVGIPVGEGEKLSMADVGLIAEADRLVLILQEPAAPSYVAAMLADAIPLPVGSNADDYGTQGNYRSCGQYRIVSADTKEITLEPNPHWTGTEAEFKNFCCRADG